MAQDFPPSGLRVDPRWGGSDAGVWSVASNACVSDRRQRERGSGVKPSVEAASCSLDAMVRPEISYSHPRHPVRRWPLGSGLRARAVAAIRTSGRAYSQAGTSAQPGRSPVGQSAKSPVSVMNAASQKSTPKRQMKKVSARTTQQAAIRQTFPQVAGTTLSARMGDLPNACVSDRRQRAQTQESRPT
jgi:hypothetical protein